MAYDQSKNPFYVDSSDDYAFSHPSSRGGGYSGNRDPFMDDQENTYNDVRDQIQQSMKRQTESTQRSVGLIYESERMGIATAEELVHQGEQLNNVETKLDQISQDMNSSQRHINNIKSVFGGIKNWWSGKKDSPKAPVDSKPSSSLEGSLSSSGHQADSHPAMRFKSDEPGGLYSDRASSAGQRHQTQGFAAESGADRSTEWRAYEEQLDTNLDTMSSGLSKLKGLGLGLGDEIKRQNEQIDRIQSKADRTDVKMTDQNRQMRHILKK